MTTLRASRQRPAPPTRTPGTAPLFVAHQPVAVLRPGPALSVGTVLSTVVAGLMTIGSLLGLLVDDLYPEQPWAVAAFRGNDLVTLLLAAPVLAGSILLYRRRKAAGAALAWLGMLFYAVYNFAYYAFGAAFNDVFLLHVATLTLSLIGLVLVASSVRLGPVAERMGVSRRYRPVAGFMILVGSALIAGWGGLSLRFALTGKLPEDVMPPSAVHLVYALDLSLLAPAFLLGGILLWHRLPWGFVLGVAVNAFGAAYLTVLEFVGGYQADAGIAGKTWWSPVGIVSPLLCLAAVVILLTARRPRR